MLVIFINDIESAMEVLVKRGTDFANKFRTTSSKFVLQVSKCVIEPPQWSGSQRLKSDDSLFNYFAVNI